MMKAIKFHAFVLVSVVMCVSSIASDVDVAVALEKCRNSLVRIVSVDCEATESTKSGRKCSLQFLQDRDLFRVDRSDKGPFKVGSESFPPLVASMAYDGRKYQNLSDGLLQLSDVKSPVLLAVQPHLLVYKWLGLEYGARREQLLDEKVWKEVKSRCSNAMAIVGFENEECAVLSLTPKGGKKGEIKVFLAANKGYFPMGFEGTIEGKPTLTCHVKEMHSIRRDGVSIWFPTVVDKISYKLDGSFHEETICKVDPSTLKVNLPVNQSRFTIPLNTAGTEILDHNVLNASIRPIQRVPKNSWWSMIAIGVVAVVLAFFVWMRSNAKK